MDLPESLPARLFLLAYDPAKGRLTARGRLGFLLRAAALADLLLGGHIEDAGGRPRADARAPLPADPALAAVLDEIGGSRPRSWQHWIRRHGGATRTAVAEQLAAARWIERQPHKVLGVLPSTRIVLCDQAVVGRLGNRVRAALRAGTPVAEVERRDAAMVALAAAGELSTVLPGPQRREHAQRISAFTEAIGPVVAALRKVLQRFKGSPADGGDGGGGGGDGGDGGD
ncbi:MAG TPA: GPP34 family phosphoprotein [Pseudonocardiaceae bacterium]